MLRLEKVTGRNVWDILKLRVRQEQRAEGIVVLRNGRRVLPVSVGIVANHQKADRRIALIDAEGEGMAAAGDGGVRLDDADIVARHKVSALRQGGLLLAVL